MERRATGVSVITFPQLDAAFRAHVEAAQAQLGYWDGEHIEKQIKLAYPHAATQRASALATFFPEQETWYVYRDGRPKPAPSGAEWWLDPELPTTIMRATGEYTDANEAAAELFGVPREQIVGARAGDFTRHESSAEVERRLFAALNSHGWLHSTAVVTRPDGAEWPVEFHTRAVPDSGQYITVMRRM
jgi:PAS domain S-box-containing protein